MTNEEAGKIIKQFRDRQGNSSDDVEAFDMANKALEQTELNSSYNSVKSELEDCVSREEAIKEFQVYREYSSNMSNADWVNRIETVLTHLPSVTSQQKVGKWKYRNGELAKKHESFGVYCSECDEWSEYSTDYCPNCGADMRGEDEKIC